MSSIAEELVRQPTASVATVVATVSEEAIWALADLLRGAVARLGSDQAAARADHRADLAEQAPLEWCAPVED